LKSNPLELDSNSIEQKIHLVQIVGKIIENLQIVSIICDYNVGKKKGGVLNKHLSFPFHSKKIPNQK
jgi:hypothetical protein